MIRNVGQAEIAALLLASNQALPGITAFSNDFLGVLLVLAFSAEGKLVLRLSVWDFIDTEPLIGGPEKTWQMALNVFDVVQFRCKRVVDLEKLGLACGQN